MPFGGRRLHAIARRRGVCRFAVALLVVALAVGASSAFGATGDLTETACVDFDSFHGCTNLQLSSGANGMAAAGAGMP